MEWENPLQTFLLFILFIYTTLYINAEYAFCCPIFIILAVFTKSFTDRKSGKFRKYWVENGNSSSPNNEKHEPVGTIRVAVLGFRNIPSLLPEHSGQSRQSGVAESVKTDLGQGQRQRQRQEKKRKDGSLSNMEEIGDEEEIGRGSGGEEGGRRGGEGEVKDKGKGKGKGEDQVLSVNRLSEGRWNPRSTDNGSTALNMSELNSTSVKKNLKSSKNAPLPFVKVTYLPMSCTDLERIESESIAEDENREEDIGNHDDGEESKEDVQNNEKDIVRRKRKENKDGKKDKLNNSRRELFIGCLSSHQKIPSMVNDSSFSQLVASLSLGLSRSESQTNDSFLHNTQNPWPRAKETKNNNNYISSNNHNYNSNSSNDYNDDNNNEMDSPSKPYYPHRASMDEEEEVEVGKRSRVRRSRDVNRHLTLNLNPNPNLPFSSSSSSSSSSISVGIKKTEQKQGKEKDKEQEQEIDISLVYPVLQPQTKVQINSIHKTNLSYCYNLNNFNSNDKNTHKKSQKNSQNIQKLSKLTTKKKTKGPFFLPWSRNESVVKFSMFTDDPASFLGSSWGFAKIFIKDFLSECRSDEEGMYVLIGLFILFFIHLFEYSHTIMKLCGY